MPARKTRCKKCRDCVANCSCSCDACWDFRFKLGVKRIKYADGDPRSLTTPLDPSVEDGERCASGLGDGSNRRAQAQAGLASLARCQPSLAEWFRLCLAIRCLHMLELGQQGPAEGSVLDDGVLEDRTRRNDHQAASSRSASRTHERRPDPHLQAVDMEEMWLHPGGGAPARHAPTDALALQFCGGWQNTQIDGLEDYLKHLGVGWAKRKVALSFKPEASWAVVDGVLQVVTPTPIGDRLETFRLGESEVDVDPDGNRFWKRSEWKGARLVTTATDANGVKPPFVTERWVEPKMGRLTQVSSHDDFSFTRVFELNG